MCVRNDLYFVWLHIWQNTVAQKLVKTLCAECEACKIQTTINTHCDFFAMTSEEKISFLKEVEELLQKICNVCTKMDFDEEANRAYIAQLLGKDFLKENLRK